METSAPFSRAVSSFSSGIPSAESRLRSVPRFCSVITAPFSISASEIVGISFTSRYSPAWTRLPSSETSAVNSPESSK